jgi:Cu(I)/Ag(I) efflux system membrane protein CusA/SilA
MNPIAPLFAALLLGIAGLSAAQPASVPTEAAAPAAAAMPLVDGVVRKLDPASRLIVLRHGEIPNLAMPAMTMGFEIADKKLLEGLKVGDKVRFQAEMVKGKATVTELRAMN